MNTGLISWKQVTAVVLPLFMLAGCQTWNKKNQVSVNYYNIKGNSTAALDREIRRKGPKIDGGRHAVAVARIKIVPNVAFQSYSGGCRVSRAKVTVDAKVTLPRWKGRKTASEKLGEAWDSIDRYTRLHEAVHVSTAFRYARRMETDLLALDEKVSCRQLRQQARILVDNYLDQHDAAQKKFDIDEQKRFSELSKKETGRKSG